MSHGSRKGPESERPLAAVRLAQLDELEVRVEQLVSGGDGLARFEGIPIFIPLSAPGDRLRVRLVERRPHYGRAEIVEILEQGPARREPPCPHFAECGGCDLQHIEDSLQTDLKADAVRETLSRLAGIRFPDDVRVLSGAPWGYRLRTQVHAEIHEGGARVGYFRRRSHRLVPVAACPVCAPELEAAMLSLGGHLEGTAPRRVNLARGDSGAVTAAPVIPGVPHGEVTISVGGLDYAFDARCFFQANRPMLGKLVATVVGEWEGREAYDLYGGVGLFALPLSRRYRRVEMVEADSVAARYARINIRRNRMSTIGIEHRVVESWVADLPSKVDRVVVDPPRAGLSARVREVIVARRPRRISYVSCHPAAMARDLAELVTCYELESLVLLDLFPQTAHMEVVAQLSVRGSESL